MSCRDLAPLYVDSDVSRLKSAHGTRDEESTTVTEASTAKRMTVAISASLFSAHRIRTLPSFVLSALVILEGFQV